MEVLAMGYNKALYIYNGNAGKEAMEEKLAQTLPILSQAIKQLIIIQTESIEDARTTCIDYASHIDLLIILGGDGTIHNCINAIAPLNERPVIAILPGGTSNDITRMLQIPQNLYQAASAIIDGKVVPIDVGKADDRYFLNFWGIGLVAETSQNIDNDQKKNLGVLSYFMSTLKTVGQAKSFSYELKTSSDRYQGEAVMVIVLNGKYLGTREIPITSISPSDGRLDVLIVKNSSLASFRELLSMNNPETEINDLQEIKYTQTNRLHIHTNETKDVDTDGEIISGTPSTIEILPSHLRMIKATSN